MFVHDATFALVPPPPNPADHVPPTTVSSPVPSIVSVPSLLDF